MIELLTYNLTSMQLQGSLSSLFHPQLCFHGWLPWRGLTCCGHGSLQHPTAKYLGERDPRSWIISGGKDWISHPYSVLSGFNRERWSSTANTTAKSSSTPSTVACCDCVLKLCFAFLLLGLGKGYPHKIIPCLGIGGWWIWFHAPLTCLTRHSRIPAARRGTRREDYRVGFPSCFAFSGLMEQRSCTDLPKPAGD